MAEPTSRAQKFIALLKEMDIEVEAIMFLRPLHEFIYADVSQVMKEQFATFLETRKPLGGLSLEQYAQRRANALRIWEFLDDWSNLIGPENVSVHSYKNIRMVVEEHLGFPLPDWNVHRDKSNVSLRLADCEKLIAMLGDEACSDEEITEAFETAFQNIGKKDPGRTKEREILLEENFSQHYEYLQQRFDFDPRS
jgi:hypothetical protein